MSAHNPHNAPPELTLAPIALGVRDAALILGIGERLLADLAAAGEVPSFRVRRRRLFRVADLNTWAEAQSAAATEGGDA